MEFHQLAFWKNEATTHKYNIISEITKYHRNQLVLFRFFFSVVASSLLCAQSVYSVCVVSYLFNLSVLKHSSLALLFQCKREEKNIKRKIGWFQLCADTFAYIIHDENEVAVRIKSLSIFFFCSILFVKSFLMYIFVLHRDVARKIWVRTHKFNERISNKTTITLRNA